MRYRLVCFVIVLNLFVGSIPFALHAQLPTKGASEVIKLDTLSSELQTFGPSTAITTCTELQNIRNDLSGDYHLANDIDCSATSGWNGGAGFDPLGNSSGAFTGTFNGSGYSIKNLTINRSSTQRVGLFGWVNNTSTIVNVTLVNINVNGSKYTGGLVGENNGGKILKSSVEGRVVSNSSFVGGLVGLNTNNGLVDDCSTDVYVEAFSTAGCFAGQNGEYLSDATISNSLARGTAKGIKVDSNDPHDIAGFSGVNFGYISLSKSYAVVTGVYLIGGFVGSVPKGNITNCIAKGTVNGNNHVGGFVGNLVNDPELHRCGSIATVTGTASSYRIGGFVGYSAGSGLKDPTINNSYSNSDVSGDDRVGGFGGEITDATSVNYCYSAGKVTGNTQTGGLLGSRGGTSSFTNCYLDNETSEQSQDVGSGAVTGITNRSTSDMMKQSTFTGWDFILAGDGIIGYWIMAGYPHLQARHTDEITDVVELQLMSVDLNGDYVLLNDIAAENTTSWNSEAGFKPIGATATPFTGTLDGMHFDITGLTIYRPGVNSVGMFGVTDTGTMIQQLDLVEVSVYGQSNLGGLIGEAMAATIDNCSSSGEVTASNADAGGIVGYGEYVTIRYCSSSANISSSAAGGGMAGTLSNAYYLDNCRNTGTISGSGDDLGGLVGWFNGNYIANSYSTGDVLGTTQDIGGLVGQNDAGKITNCYATGSVKGTWYVGGLIGWNNDAVTNCYSTGSVKGTGGNVGGLVGRNVGGAVNTCNSSSFVNGTGINNVGGLIGYNTGIITGCHAEGGAVGSQSIGGLVGTSTNSIIDSKSTGSVTATSNFAGGLVGECTETASFITNCYSISNVNGFSYTGGLVGRNYIPIYNSWSSGSVWATGSWVGGLLGYNGDSASNCTSSSSVQGDQYVGGLVGFEFSGATIEKSYSTGRVNGSTNVGGLVGYVSGVSSTITISYSMSNVSGTSSVGGLVGRFDGLTLNNSYSQGNVSGTSSFVGGFIGLLEGGVVNNSYSTGKVEGLPSSGGLMGNASGGSVEHCFWDIDTSGRTNSVGGTGKNTIEMMTRSTFTNVFWNFTTIWGIAEGKTYPFLRYWYMPISLLSIIIPAAIEDQFYSTKIEARLSDYPQGFIPDWTMTTVADSWLSLGPDGTLSGMPLNADVGTYMVNITVIGLLGESDSFDFTLNVINTNDPPVIITMNLTNATENTLYEFFLNATDIDPTNDILTWKISTNASWLSQVNPGGRKISGWPQSNDDIGTYWVLVNVSDGKGGYDERNYTITVFNTNDNPKMVIFNVLSATEDVLYSVDYEASDPDPTNDILSWTLSTNASWLSIDPATGVLSGTPTNDDVGSYWVHVFVLDGKGGQDSTNFTLKVYNVNDDPIIETADATSAIEDVFYYVDYNASDIDPTNDTFTWGLVTAATWLSIDTSTGVLSGTPRNDDVGDWDVIITVEDSGGGSNSSFFTITVINTNDPPVMFKSGVSRTTKEDEPYSHNFNAVDYDPTADAFYWALYSDASWLNINTGSGVLTGTPTNSDVGSCWVNVTVRDGKGGEDFFNYTLEVVNVNDPPTIITEDVDTAKVGEKYSVDYNATDIDPTEDTFTWWLATNATWLSIDSATGVLSGTPGDDDAGSYRVNITVGDGNGGFDHREFTLVVKPGAVIPVDNLNPVIVTDDVTTATANKLYRVYYNATDDRTPASKLEWTLKTNATWLSFDAGTSVLSGTPTLSDVGSYWVEITVSDGEGGMAGRNFTLIVYKTLPGKNENPVITTSELPDAPISQNYLIKLTATDDRTSVSDLRWSMVTNTAWLQLNKETGELSGIPVEEDRGEYWVLITVVDDENGMAFKNFSISVVSEFVAPQTFDLKINGTGSVILRDPSGNTVSTGAIGNNQVVLVYQGDLPPGPYTVYVDATGDYEDAEWKVTLHPDGTWSGPGTGDDVVFLEKAEPLHEVCLLYYLLPIILFVVCLVIAFILHRRGGIRTHEGKADAECYKCGAIVPADATSCLECGAEFEEIEETTGVPSTEEDPGPRAPGTDENLEHPAPSPDEEGVDITPHPSPLTPESGTLALEEGSDEIESDESDEE